MLQSWEYYLELNLVNSGNFPFLHNFLHCLEAIIIFLFNFFFFAQFSTYLLPVQSIFSSNDLDLFSINLYILSIIMFSSFWRNFSMTCCSVERLSSARVVLASLVLFTLLEIFLHFSLAGYPVSSVWCLLSGLTPLFWWSTSSSDFPWKDV